MSRGETSRGETSRVSGGGQQGCAELDATSNGVGAPSWRAAPRLRHGLLSDLGGAVLGLDAMGWLAT
ncbi:MAG TPA: hypothetical protein VFJ95_15080 [Gammaproteobacteria bacterium]|nr:hypothetical protein [Gammaproteobacteria bacterium]